MTEKKQTKKDISNLKGKVVAKEIEIKLTEKEIKERHKKHASLQKELDEINLEFKEAADIWKRERATFKEKIKKISEEMSRVAKEAREEKAIEVRDCLFVKNQESGNAEYYHPHSGKDMKLVMERPLEYDERQSHMFEEEAASLEDDGHRINDDMH